MSLITVGRRWQPGGLPAGGPGHEAAVLLVANGSAGRTVREAVAAVAEVLAEAGPVELVECDHESDLDRALRRWRAGPLVLAGGDGSLHTTLRQLWHRGEAGAGPIGLVPLGTGNDFARGVGIPLDPVAAAKTVLTGAPRRVDLVTDDAGGVVVNAMHVGVGADAAVRARPLKRSLKSGAFPLGALLAGLRVQGWRLRIEVDGKAVVSGRRRVLMAGLANAPSIAGGTADLWPGASPTDGLADVVISTAVEPLARAGYALGLLRGNHAERDDVLHLTGRTLSISGDRFQINADGEVSDPVRYRMWTVQPGAWHCILPAPSGPDPANG
ncbi:MAG TPA: diacylglycerol kinase family protein [Micromonosporaceae bacterium]